MRVDPRTATMTSECKSGPSPVAAGGSSDVGEPVDPPDWWTPGPPILGPVDSPLNRWTPIACLAPYILFVNSAARTCKRV